MPAGIIAPVLGGVLGLIGTNVANKATQKAADTAGDTARSIAQQGYTQASGNEQQAVASARQALEQWFSQNPGPASGWGNIQPPTPSGPSFLGGSDTMPANSGLQYALHQPQAFPGFGQGAGFNFRRMRPMQASMPSGGQQQPQPQPRATMPVAQQAPIGGQQQGPGANSSALQELLQRIAARRGGMIAA